MHARKAFLVVTFAVLAVRCSRKDARDDGAAGLAQGALHSVPRDGGAPSASLEWLRDDGSAEIGNVAITLDEDAPDGVFVKITVLDDDGGVMARDQHVAFCVKHAARGERVVLPVDPAVGDDGKALLRQASRLGVMHVTRAPGCLRPTLRVEKLLLPRAAASDGGGMR